MTNQARGYTLPITLIEQIEALPKSRSTVVAESLHKAGKSPALLISALKRRYTTPNDRSRNSRVTVSMSPVSLDTLSVLTDLTQLGTEHVLRLALEDYLHEK